MRNVRVALVGHVCIDHNISEHATYAGWGSALLYMAHHWRGAHGIDPVLVTSYGEDFQKYRAGFTVVPPLPQLAPTLVYENRTHAGRRTQRVLHAGHSGPPVINEDVIEVVAEADVIVVAPLLPNYPAAYLRQLLAHRKEDSLTVLSPQGYLRAVKATGEVEPRPLREAKDIMPLFDLVVFSEADCAEAKQRAGEWAAMGDTHVIMTQGSEGASLISRAAVTQLPTDPVADDDIVDSVGCGDVFTAAVAHSLFMDRDLQWAVQTGHQAARTKLFQPASRF